MKKQHSDDEMFRAIDDDKFNSNIKAFGDYGGNAFGRNIKFDGISEYEAEDGDGIEFSGRVIA